MLAIHDVGIAGELGWDRLSNGELLRVAEADMAEPTAKLYRVTHVTSRAFANASYGYTFRAGNLD
jgi:hypothetical protein